MRVFETLPLLFWLATLGCSGGVAGSDVTANDAMDTSVVGDDGVLADTNDSSVADVPRLEGYLDRYPLNARFPEGGAFDTAANVFYVGSLDDGSVHRIDARTGTETVLFTETAPGHWWTLGMTVDAERRRLWVCAMDDRSPSPRAGRIWIFDLALGMRIADHALSAAAADATCTDVAVTRSGRGYVGDREQGNVYEVDEALGATLFTSGPELRGTVIGQNAMIVLPDESALLSLIYKASAIVRVGLADRSLTTVTLDGRFAETNPLYGADGMAYANGSAYVAFTSRLVRVTPSGPDWTHASATGVSVTDGMTDVISTPNGLYLLNGQAVRFAFGGAVDPFALVRFDGSL